MEEDAGRNLSKDNIDKLKEEVERDLRQESSMKDISMTKISKSELSKY